MRTIRTLAKHFLAATAAAVALTAQAGSVWLDAGTSVKRVDTATAQVVATVGGVTPRSMAAARDGSAWVLGQGALRKFSPAGATSVNLGLNASNLPNAEVLAVDRYTGDVWVTEVDATGSTQRLVVRLDASGNRLAEFPALSNTRAIAIDLDPSVWVLNNQQVARYGPTGTLLGSVTVYTMLTAAPQMLAVDGMRRYAWVAGGKQVLRLDAAALNATPLMVTVPDAIGGMDVDQETGELWVALDSELRVFSAQGALLRTISRTSLSVSPIRTVAFDGTGGKAWVGHGSGVASVNRDGTLGTNVALGQVVAGVVATGFIPAPVVSLTAPVNGATYAAPANVTLTAAASVAVGSIAKVEFFQGATLVGTSTTTPYTAALSGLVVGSYSFTAVATDTHGITATSSAVSITVSGVANVAPTVSITAPSSGAVFAAPASFTITANAADSDGTVSKVEFFQGATLIGTVTSAPYSVNVSGLASGTYSYTAKVTDNLNATTTSVAVQVISDALPTVSITAPANNAVFTAPASITLTAAASDSDGTISQVEFLQGATLVGTVTTAPYTATLSGVAAGNYSYTAKATDNLGLATTSAAINVLVNAPPAVSITAPANNAVFAAPGSFMVTADANDSDGSIAKVEFFQGATLIATATSAPYAASVSSLAAGSYSFTAKATDNLGATTTSAAVQVLVDALPSVSLTSPANNAAFTAPASITLTASASDPDGTVAKVEFFQGASLVGTSTTAPYTVTLTGVAAGSYSYTSKATDNAGLSSTSSAVVVVVNAPPSIAITAPASGTAFASPGAFTLQADASDTDGSIAKVEFFQGATLVGTATAVPYAASVSGLAPGTYSFTAKATDNLGATTTSNAVQVIVSAAPTVSITAPANNAVYPAPASVTLTATANDPDGPIAKVEFYQGATLVSTVTTAPYATTLSGLAAGTYTFTAKATDNVGLTTTSSTVTVIVDALPTVSLTAPANGATFTAPATINLSATASDSDGTIASVEFYQGSTLIGTVSSPPYNLSWNNVAQGSYILTAKATDDRGLSATSAGIAITVKAPAQLHYIHPDQLGTPRMITRTSDNQVTWRWDNSEPFGNSQPNENPSGLGAFAFNLRFPGQYFDAETGTSYNYWRDYDPSIGRYIQSDPIGFGGGLNTYAYVGATPLTLTDVAGLYDPRMRGAPGNDPYPGCPGTDPGCRSGMPQPQPVCCDNEKLATCLATTVTLAGSCQTCARTRGVNIGSCAKCARSAVTAAGCYAQFCK